MLKKIILVFKTHFDIGFTDLSSTVIDKYSDSMLKEVIATCKATQHLGRQQYVWTMPSWPLKVIIERCSSEQRKELDLLIDRGQIVWHALPFTSHTDFCSADEYIEGLRFGKELSEYYHKPYAISAKMTDVPGHSIMLPSILSGARVKFLHLGCNEFANPPKVPFLFYWQSLSGEQVLTMYSKGGYGTSLLPPKSWNYPVWMALMQTHDNSGPQSAEMIERMVKDIHDKYPDTEVICGSMDDFYNELSKYDLTDLPIIKKDLADTWIHGIASYPKEVAIIREEREKIKRLQALYAKQKLKVIKNSDDKLLKVIDESDSRVMEALKDDDRIMEALDNYFEDTCLFEEHTWGADVKTWLGPDRVYSKKDFIEAKHQKNYQFMESSWEEQKHRAKNASADRCKLELLIEKERGRNHFFNPNLTEYTGWVLIDKLMIDFNTNHIEMNGEGLPVTMLNGQWACFVHGLPAFSMVPIIIKEGAIAAEGLIMREEMDTISIQNHRYILSFNSVSGEILSLYDKKLMTMLLEKYEDNPIFAYQYDRYGIEEVTNYLRDYAYRFSTWGIRDYGREAYPECNHKTYIPKFTSYNLDGHTITLYYEGVESGDQYGDAKEVSLEITLPPIGEEVFLKLNLLDKQETPYIESASLLFPFANAQTYRINKSNCVLDPEKDIAENANNVFYCLENYMSAENEKNGFCIVTKDAPLVSIGNTGVYKYLRKYQQAEEPIAYFNLFNNMWGTNFPQWMGGDLSYRFIIYGYDKTESKTLLERAAHLQAGIEVTSNHFENQDITLPEHMQLINARKINDSLVLRFKDLMGESALRTLKVKDYGISPVNLHNEKMKEEARDEITFQVKPYGIYSFLLQK